MGIIIFTDLDGSLLDHDGYSFQDARSSLDRIRRAQIPLIFTTSKTRPEVELLRNALGIHDPFIVENGGGIYFPPGYRSFNIPGAKQQSGYARIDCGLPYEQIRRFFVTLPKQFRARGFGDLSATEIVELTGLSYDQAVLAKIREFTEPFLLGCEDDLSAVSVLAGEQGMKVTRGGRFYHLIGSGQDKGKAVLAVQEVFRRNSKNTIKTVGIGDSDNDLPMLQNVDIPVLIPHPFRGCLAVQLPGLVRSGQPGCRGWNDVVGRLLDELNQDYEQNMK